jgi:Putative adhesin
MFVVTAALALSLMGTPAVAQAAAGSQARPPRAPETDQTVPVTRGTRLSVNNFAGEVIVRAWDRDALRVQARHTLRTRVSIRTTASGAVVVDASQSGAPGSVDYEINVPSWMSVKIEGTYSYIAVEGTQGEVSAETVRGDISVKGGSGFVTAKSIEGEVMIENARGRINASSVNESVSITGASGDIVAESTNGHITLTNVDAANVDVGTVNGNIKYDGTSANNGKYRFATHNGNISVAVPETASASFSVRTYNGSVSTGSLPLQGGGDPRRGRRATYTLGSGSAEFELESFGGTVVLRKRAAGASTAKPKDKDQDGHLPQADSRYLQ